MNNRKKIDSFDVLKVMACIAVILIHCRFPGYLGNVCRTLAKFAVPFFFMISGFFALYGLQPKVEKEKIKSKIIHITKIIIIVGIFYGIFYAVYTQLICHQTIDMGSIFTINNIIKFILANSPFIYSHLWFILALLYCYIFTLICPKKIQGKWKKYYVIIALVFFTITSEISPKFGMKLTLGNTEIAVYNIFLFRALPFYLLGMILRENRDKIIESKLTNKMCIVMIIIGFLASIIERIIFVESQFYLGTYISVIFLFIFAMKNEEVNKCNTIKFIGRYLSMYVYIIHIAVLEILNYIFAICNLGGIFNYLKPIILIIISIQISYLIYWFNKNIKYRKH